MLHLLKSLTVLAIIMVVFIIACIAMPKQIANMLDAMDDLESH